MSKQPKGEDFCFEVPNNGNIVTLIHMQQISLTHHDEHKRGSDLKESLE